VHRNEAAREPPTRESNPALRLRRPPCVRHTRGETAECPRQESNLVFDLRKVACHPSHAEGAIEADDRPDNVEDGFRTRAPDVEDLVAAAGRALLIGPQDDHRPLEACSPPPFSPNAASIRSVVQRTSSSHPRSSPPRSAKARERASSRVNSPRWHLVPHSRSPSRGSGRSSSQTGKRSPGRGKESADW